MFNLVNSKTSGFSEKSLKLRLLTIGVVRINVSKGDIGFNLTDNNVIA